MKGWFDAFRTDGGPTLYAYSNRTSVTGDVPTITICLVFLTIFFAFILVFPGVRKEVSIPCSSSSIQMRSAVGWKTYAKSKEYDHTSYNSVRIQYPIKG